ncbi:Hypothetical protein POVN_LOCUS123 [uncultured virus]|nr:Hypothetical protein POVN_LOCUS123 [uncultured virus]
MTSTSVSGLSFSFAQSTLTDESSDAPTKSVAVETKGEVKTETKKEELAALGAEMKEVKKSPLAERLFKYASYARFKAECDLKAGRDPSRDKINLARCEALCKFLGAPKLTSEGDFKVQKVQLTAKDYHFGIFSANALDLAFASACLDKDVEHEPVRVPAGDTNAYSFGSIFGVPVVLNCLPAGAGGQIMAAIGAVSVRRSFPALEDVVLFSIGGGFAARGAGIGNVVVTEGEGVVFHGTEQTLKTPGKMLAAAVGRVMERLLSKDSFIAEYADLLAFGMMKYTEYQKPAGFGKPEVLLGSIISSYSDITTEKRRDAIMEENPEALGCDTVSAGAVAAGIRYIKIHGVGHLCDGKKSEHRGYATSTAAAMLVGLFEVIAEGLKQ